MQGAAPAGEIAVTRWHPLALPADVSGVAQVEELVLAGYYDYAVTAAARVARQLRRPEPVRRVRLGPARAGRAPVRRASRARLDPRGARARASRRVDRGGSRPDARARRERRAPLHARDRREPRASVRAVRQPVRARRCGDDPQRARACTSPPQRSNLIAIAAPVGSGRYTRAQLERVVVTAYTGFAAAVHEDGSGTRRRGLHRVLGLRRVRRQPRADDRAPAVRGAARRRRAREVLRVRRRGARRLPARSGGARPRARRHDAGRRGDRSARCRRLRVGRQQRT